MGFVTGALTLGNVVGTIPVGILARRFRIAETTALLLHRYAAISILRTMTASIPAQIGLAFLAGWL